MHTSRKPLRIAFFVGAFPALSETFVLDQMAFLIEKGHDVHVFSEQHSQQSVLHDGVQQHSLLERTTFFDHDPSIAAGTLTKMLRKVRKSTFDVASYRIDRAASTLRASRKPKPIAFDAILCHFGPRGVVALALRDRGLIEGPIATFFHAYELSRSFTEAWSRAYRELGTRSEAVLPCTEHWQRVLRKDIGVPEHRLSVHRMGVRVPESAMRSYITKGQFRITIVGRLEPKKGHGTLLKAFASANIPDGILTVVGDGTLRSELESLAFGELKLTSSSVRFVGAVTPDAVRSLLDSETDVFCLPSETAADGDKEGLPVAIMEAMAAGLPTISTRHSGIPELIVDDRTGLLIDERDHAALADAIKRLYTDQALRERLGCAGREAVRKRFNQEDWNRVLESRCVELAASYAR